MKVTVVCDNNFAITTRDLATSLNKAASTAKTFNVSLDEMLGYSTAIGVATRESGSIVGNSLKTIFSRITTNSQAIGALAGLGISITDQAGEMRAVSDIISELAGRWGSLSDAEKQNTAVRVAGTNQLSRFNALMLNYDMAVQATETSINSQNSAMAEQNKYSESLEARINRLNTAWYDFAGTMGESILYDGIVVITSIFKGATEGAGGLISSIGALAPIFGIAGIAILALSRNFRQGTIAMGEFIAKEYTASAATTMLGRASDVAAAGMMKLRTSLVAISSMLGMTAAFFALGFAIEKLTGFISDNIQKQEEYDQRVNTSISAITTNRERTEELAESYARLQKQKESGGLWSTEQEQEYLKVQNDLAELMPNLVSHIDATGQAHLKNTDAIRAEIALTEELAKKQARLTIAESEDTFKEMGDKINGAFYTSMNNFVYGSLEKQIKATKALIKTMEEQGDFALAAKYEFQLAKLEQQVADSSQEIKGKMYEVADAFIRVNDVAVDPKAAQAVKSFVDSLDLSKLSPEKLTEFAKEFAEIQKVMSISITNKDSKGYEDAVKRLNDLAKEASNGKEDYQQFKVSYDEFVKTVEKGGSVVVNASGEFDEMNDSVEGLIDATYDYANAQERLAGVSQKQIDDTSDLIFQYEMLTAALGSHTEAEIKSLEKKSNLTAEEQVLVETLKQRDTVMEQLLAIYPSLLSADGKAIKSTEEKIKAVQREQKANETLLKAYQLARDGKLNSEQITSLATATGTKNRIKAIGAEIEALKLLQKQMYHTNMSAQEFAKGVNDGTVKNAGHSFVLPETFMKQEISQKEVEKSELQRLLDINIGSISNFTSAIEESSKSSKSNSKATKDNNKAKEESVWITDKFKQKQEQLNLAIAKQTALMEEQYKGSNKRRLALQEQIKLEQQKLEVLRGQEKTLKSQIATGKIQQTGNVKVSNTNAQATGTVQGGKKIGGAFDYRISSAFGTRSDNHRGTDFAAPRGTPINSPVSGTVIKSGAATSNKNGKAMHWSYGNIVVVQDDQGVQHLMAHMDKTMAKLGDKIVAGTQVGTVGTTGNSTGNHLHYEQNKNGRVLNPNATIKAIRNGTMTTQSGTNYSGGTVGYADNGQEALDRAKSELIGTQQDVIAQEKLLKELQAQMVDEILQSYENRKDAVDKTLQNVDNNMKKLAQSSAAYRFELDKQGKALLDKRKVNQEEIAYLQNVLAKGKLTDAQLFELQNRLQELKNTNADIDMSISENYTAKIESLNAMLEETANKFAKVRSASDDTINYLTVAQGDLDKSSIEYVKSLEAINKAMKDKQSANRKELQDLQKLISTGVVYGQALTNAKKRVTELTTEIKQLQLDIQEGNFEVLITVKNNSDEVVDNIQFEISRLEEIRKMYEQGSGDYLKYTEEIVKQQQKLASQYESTRDALMAELKQQDISKERIKEVKEMLEDLHIAYLQATNGVKDYTKQVEEANNSNLEKIATDVINAIKKAYQELRDEHMKAIDDTLKKEAEAHDKRLKALKDEQDLFRKNVEERLRLIDRQESQRSYDMEIDDMEKERSKIQARMFAISKDDSYSAKKERKQLQEQLDKIDKDIAEKRHDRDIELQKQGLNDLLEQKDQEIEDKTEAENEKYEQTVDRLNKEKAYYEKYYNDLLNDERKFAKMREDIMAGHFDEIEKEFKGMADKLRATMPELADTLDGTMQAVGMTIRQNVIDELEAALKAMEDFKKSASEVKNSFVDNFDPNGDFSSGSGGVDTSKGNLSSADMQVLMGKFMYDKVGAALTGQKQTDARNKGSELGKQGYKGGSQIDSGLNFDSAVAGLTAAEKEAFAQYLQGQKGANGGAYDRFIDQFLSGQNVSSNLNMYGVKTPMSYGDMQVMMAKYMRELLINEKTPQALKDQVQAQANAMASEGRASGSKVSADVRYGQVLASLDKTQRSQFKSFLSNQSGMIQNQYLKDQAKKYAASLDTGGMLNFAGAGIDGKGGKMIIAHNGEVVNNPIETQQLLQSVDSARVMLQHLKELANPLRNMMSVAANANSPTSGGDTFEFIFQGDFINTTRTQMENLAGAAMNEARAKKGMFSRYV